MARQEYPGTQDMKVVFGDWCFATLRGVKEDKPKGKVAFVFVPDPFMRWFHNIQDKDYDDTFSAIKKEYDEELCHLVNRDPKHQTWFLLCDYNGKKCDPSIGINHELIIKNNALKSERDALERAFILYKLKTRKIITHPEEFTDEIIKRMVKQKEITKGDFEIGGVKKDE